MLFSVLLVLALAAQGYARPNCFFACDYPVGQVPMPGYPGGGGAQPGYPSGSLVQPGYPGGAQPGYPSGSPVQPGYPGGAQPGYPSGSLVQPGYPSGPMQRSSYQSPSGSMVQPGMVETFGPVYPPMQPPRMESFQPGAGSHLSFNHESQSSQKTSISGSYHFPAPLPPMNEPMQKPCRIYSDCS